MKLRVCAMGVAMASTLALWACTSTLPGNGGSGVDGGGGGEGPGQDGGGTTEQPGEGGVSTSNLVFLPDPQGFCNRVIGCEEDAGAQDAGTLLTNDDCLTAFQPTKFTQACVAALNTSSCADIVGAFPAKAECFPPCSAESATCNGDGTITVCGGGEIVVLDCVRACSSKNGTYAGSCGKSFQGQSSPTGKDQCWCK